MRTAVTEVAHWRNIANAIRATSGVQSHAAVQVHRSGVRMCTVSADKAVSVEAATRADLGELQGVVTVGIADLAGVLARAVAVSAEEVVLQATLERAALDYASASVRMHAALQCVDVDAQEGAGATGLPPPPLRGLTTWGELLAGIRRVKTSGCARVTLEARGGALRASTLDNRQSAPVTGVTRVADSDRDGYRATYCIQRILAFADLFPPEAEVRTTEGDVMVVNSGPNVVTIAAYCDDD